MTEQPPEGTPINVPPPDNRPPREGQFVPQPGMERPFVPQPPISQSQPPPAEPEPEEAEDEEEEESGLGSLSSWVIDESEEELDPFNGSPPFTVRALNNGDVYKVAPMMGRVMDEPMVINAMSDKNQLRMGMVIAGVLIQKVERPVQLWLADMVGIKKQDFREMEMEMQRRCLNAEGQQVLPFPLEDKIVRAIEEDVLERFGNLPLSSTPYIISKILKDPDFGPFWRGFKLAFKTGRGTFSKLRMS
jgi:hypothetical protein